MSEIYTIEPTKKELYLVANWRSNDRQFSLEITSWKPMGTSKQILLETFEVEKGTTISHNVLTQMMLNKLDENDSALQATYFMDKKDNEEVRQSLLAITHQPEPSGADVFTDEEIIEQSNPVEPFPGDENDESHELLDEAVDAVFDVPEAANDADFEEVEDDDIA